MNEYDRAWDSFFRYFERKRRRDMVRTGMLLIITVVCCLAIYTWGSK